MKFVDMINSHARWKAKFKAAIDNKEQLDAAVIAKDNCCELGKWLYDTHSVEEYSHLASYTDCVAVHAQFHQEAARIALLINEALYEEAQKQISHGSHYAKLSTAVSASIRRINKEIAQDLVVIPST